MHTDRHLFETKPNTQPPTFGTHTQGTRPLQPPVRPFLPTNQTTPPTKKRRTHTRQPTKQAHTHTQCDPRPEPVGNNRMTKHTARRKETILPKRKQTKIRKHQTRKSIPEHTNHESKIINDKITKKSKSNMARNRSAPQRHRTNTHTTSTMPEFWPTSSSSTEFACTKSITVEFFPPPLSKNHPSQLHFPDTKQHHTTMPLAKMDIIRTKQSEIVSAVVTLAKYTGKVYKPMTPYQFQLELQNVERMDTLYTRT
jgi:hypothetical protein